MTEPKPNQFWRGIVIVVILGIGGIIAFASSPGWPIQDYDGYLHFAAFAMITLLAVIAWPRAARDHLFAGLVVLAGVTELLQFIPGISRTPSWTDFAFNICGIAFMLGIVAAARALTRR